MAVAGQHIGIGPANCAGQQAVLYRPAVHEQILLVSDPAIERRQPGDTGQAHHACFTGALERDGDAVVPKLSRDDGGHAVFETFALHHCQGSAAAMVESERYVGPSHGEAPHGIEHSRIFAPGGAQELAPRGHLCKQIFHPHPGSRRQCGRFIGNHAAVIDDRAPARVCLTRAAFQSEPGDAGD